MKKITFWSVVISAITLFSACTLYLDEPELEETNRKGFDEPVHETTDKYDVTYQFNEGVHYLQQENVDDYRDRLDELEREEYYESKYGKEKE